MHDFKRLEEAVASLVDRYRRSLGEVADLRRSLAERDERLAGQAQQIALLGERNRDVAKRLDDLIGELDRLDEQLAQGAAAEG
jgi:chromosome segregation ATPase